MAKLSGAMVKALREAAGHPAGYVNTHATNKRTLDALRARFLIKPEGGSAVITPSGRTALRLEDERARRAEQEAERLSRPVPASAFVEPSASKPVHAFPEYEDEPAGSDEVTVELPSVPEPHVAQVVRLLEHGARIVLDGSGHWSSGVSWIHAERLDAAANEAIRRGIAEPLPPTLNGTVRLALKR